MRDDADPRRGSLDGALSRFLHAANRPECGASAVSTRRPGAATAGAATGDMTVEEQEIVESANQHLADGIALLRWWETAARLGQFTERFDLERTYNRASSSYGFFGSLDIRGNGFPVMGNVQEMLYDNARGPARFSSEL